jgi:exonuclease VII large subunit
MLPSITQMRLQQLEDNVVRVLELLNDYEVELLDEFDPGTKSKYRRRIENLKQQRDNYEKELVAIQDQLSNEQSGEQVSIIVSQLQEIDSKLNWLASSQVALHQIVLAHFTTEEKILIEPVTRQLEEAQIIEVKSVLEAIESNQVTEEETDFIVAQLQQVLSSLKERNFALPSGNESIVEALNYPTLDTKHALKVSIPIIPFILSYEGELGLGAGVKIREAWDRWKNRLSNK